MENDRLKWNRRYSSSDNCPVNTPSAFLQEWIGLINQEATGTRALDIACGEGRNSIFLAQNGYRVTGLDISDIGIDKARKLAADCGLEIDFRIVDLDVYELTGMYDLIININFLLRPLIQQAVDALAAGGLMVFESLLATPEQLQIHNPDYLLAPGELERIFASLPGEILLAKELPEEQFPTARLLFKKS